MADDTRVRVPRSGAADGTKVAAGVRPEKIRMRDAREDGTVGHNTLLGTIRDASYLGVSTQPVELQEALRQRLSLAQESGLMLLGLEPEAPADRAGLLLGDIILSIGGRGIEDGEALQMALGPEAIGRSTTVTLIRGGQVQDVAVTPAERPN